MSNKVFITKYQASVDKDLPVLGQMIIHVTPLIDAQKKNDTSIASALGMTIGVSVPTELEIVGDSYFTNGTNGESRGKTFTITSGKNPIFFKEGTFDIVIKNKYALNYYFGAIENAENANGSANKYLNIDDLKYSTNLTYVRNNYFGEHNNFKNVGKTNGDISSLSNLTNLTSANFVNTSVSGDISSLSNNTGLTSLTLSGTSVSGDISSLSNNTNLKTLLLNNNNNISGNISSLSKLTNLTVLFLDNTSVSGDITDIVTNLTKLTQLWLPKTVTITDAQKKTLTDRGCSVTIV